MTRGSLIAGITKSGIFGAAILAGLAVPAFADDSIQLSGSAAVTTNYEFRGITQTADNPAGQVEFDATWKIFYIGNWDSNLDFGANPFSHDDLASIEMDWYGGIRPVWKGITFDIGAIYYSYPGSQPQANIPYVEVKSGASYTFFKDLTLGVVNYYSPDNSGGLGKNDVVEGDWSYAFENKWWVFTPSVSGVVGHQWGQESKGGFDYTYWNVGLTLGFNNKPPLSLDIRYWDTGGLDCPNSGAFACGPRAVGTLKATF